ncbi:MAG TPA: MASE3 domain-containing protein [Alphaproteobacteria bacterium]|nr:MASE3 domain-containing protein [Alphaproteobacteria bacterium]
MGPLLLTPEWFYGYNIALELIFAIITFSVSFYAWKIYKITQERNLRLFSLAFTFVGLSYFARALLNLVVFLRLDDEVCLLMKIQDLYLLNLFGTYVYSILFLIGILLLAYVALKIYSLQTFILMFLLVFTSLYFTPFKTFMLYLLSTLLLGFIVVYYFRNYFNNKKMTTLLVLIAMILLFTAYVSYLLSTNNAWYYFIGHIMEMVAYLIILVNLVVVSRLGRSKNLDRTKNGKKKR